MKKIILIRHAKVDIDNSKKVDSLALKKWVEQYDHAPILKESLPTGETITLVQNADVVLTSALSRAIDSAKVLGVEVSEENSLFNEAAVPNISVPYLKLRPKTWLVILRLMLFIGLGKKETSFKASKTQAKNAVLHLETLTKVHSIIALVGHGGMNWLIGKALAQRGWIQEGKSGHGNWGVTVFKMKKEYDLTYI